DSGATHLPCMHMYAYRARGIDDRRQAGSPWRSSGSRLPSPTRGTACCVTWL
ncbi:hypothetical protein COCVIDRAFT_110889, partial [Bipolaris victoriae FI3]